LRDILGQTDGNLASHFRALDEAGYVRLSNEVAASPSRSLLLRRPAAAHFAGIWRTWNALSNAIAEGTQ